MMWELLLPAWVTVSPVIALIAARALAIGLRRLEYVFPDGNLYAFDMDDSFALVKHVKLPMTQRGTRGACGSAATGMLYLSYGGVGGTGTLGNGSLLKYDLERDRIVWTRD